VVRGTFSPVRAWRPAVGARLAQTLARTRNAFLCRFSAVPSWPAPLECSECVTPYHPAAAAEHRQSGHAPEYSATHRTHKCGIVVSHKNRALRQGINGSRTTASQAVVRASRGSAAPGSQFVVVLGPAPTGQGCILPGAATECIDGHRTHSTVSPGPKCRLRRGTRTHVRHVPSSAG